MCLQRALAVGEWRPLLEFLPVSGRRAPAMGDAAFRSVGLLHLIPKPAGICKCLMRVSICRAYDRGLRDAIFRRLLTTVRGVRVSVSITGKAPPLDDLLSILALYLADLGVSALCAQRVNRPVF